MSLLAQTIRHTPDVDRILALPRRGRDVEEFGESIADDLTEVLKTPNGTQSLRPVQAAAIHDMYTQRGLFGAIPVGHGKTLISLLAPRILEAKRPMLILPAALIEKTRRELEKYAEHWRVSRDLQILSYDMLGRVQYAQILDEENPDLLIFDECHRAKNRRAAVTRRITRYMRNNPNTIVIALSGTVMNKSLLDFGHILRWCLKTNAPIPLVDLELEAWAAALDEKTEEWERPDPGALSVFAPGAETVEEVRRGFRDRLIDTPGVIAVTSAEDKLTTASLTIRALRYDVDPTLDKHFDRLRTLMQTPDGWQLMQAVDVWRHSKELALGLYYKWDPRPPEEWRNARREWNMFVRDVLAHSRTLDSELQVAQACDAGRLPNEALEAWRAVKDTFAPNVVAEWCDDAALKVCKRWMQEPGIVWTAHDLFARRLAEYTGAKYYGAKGLTDAGERIEDGSPRQAVIASYHANKEGRNLQQIWSRNLVTFPWESPKDWEQVLGRTHRSNQIADEVTVDVLLGCKEHANAWRRACAASEAIRDTTGAQFKILKANVTWPSEDEIAGYSGARWS